MNSSGWSQLSTHKKSFLSSHCNLSNNNLLKPTKSSKYIRLYNFPTFILWHPNYFSVLAFVSIQMKTFYLFIVKQLRIMGTHFIYITIVFSNEYNQCKMFKKKVAKDKTIIWLTIDYACFIFSPAQCRKS